MTSHTNTYAQTKGLSPGNATSVASPIQWLRAGFSDFIAAPGTSLLLGLSFSALCALAYAIITAMPLFAAACLTVLLATGPFIAVAAYRIAQHAQCVQLN